jgi:hypothetical protein
MDEDKHESEDEHELGDRVRSTRMPPVVSVVVSAAIVVVVVVVVCTLG